MPLRDNPEASTPDRSVPWRNPRLSARVPELDGIRGLAILQVLVWHYLVCAVHPESGSWQERALLPVRLTWSGVDLFFVLSGFLIGGILYDAKDSSSYYHTFYLRRVHRIIPVYFLWLGLFLVGLGLVGPNSPIPLRELFNRDLPTWSFVLFIQNFFMSSRQIFGPQWLAVTWSLAIEEQFYLLLPFLVRKLSYRGMIWLAVASIFGAPAVRLTLRLAGNAGMAGYTLLPSRADALGFGVLIALACRSEGAWTWLVCHRRHVYVAFSLLGGVVAFMALTSRDVYVLGLTWIAAFYALLLVLVVVNPGRVEKGLFRSYPLGKLGTVAYAVYLFHQGTNALFHFAMFGREPIITDSLSLTVTLLSLMAVLLLSALSWRVLENPLMRRGHSRYRYAGGTEAAAAAAVP